MQHNPNEPTGQDPNDPNAVNNTQNTGVPVNTNGPNETNTTTPPVNPDALALVIPPQPKPGPIPDTTQQQQSSSNTTPPPPPNQKTSSSTQQQQTSSNTPPQTNTTQNQQAPNTEQQQTNEKINASDFYDRLGVGKTATREQIKEAYKILSRKYHPDRNKSPNAQQEFRNVQEAYETLYNETKRAAYDKRKEYFENQQQRSNYFNQDRTYQYNQQQQQYQRQQEFAQQQRERYQQRQQQFNQRQRPNQQQGYNQSNYQQRFQQWYQYQQNQQKYQYQQPRYQQPRPNRGFNPYYGDAPAEKPPQSQRYKPESKESTQRNTSRPTQQRPRGENTTTDRAQHTKTTTERNKPTPASRPFPHRHAAQRSPLIDDKLLMVILAASMLYKLASQMNAANEKQLRKELAEILKLAFMQKTNSKN